MVHRQLVRHWHFWVGSGSVPIGRQPMAAHRGQSTQGSVELTRRRSSV
jgi:hypothetical protein